MESNLFSKVSSPYDYFTTPLLLLTYLIDNKTFFKTWAFSAKNKNTFPLAEVTNGFALLSDIDGTHAKMTGFTMKMYKHDSGDKAMVIITSDTYTGINLISTDSEEPLAKRLKELSDSVKADDSSKLRVSTIKFGREFYFSDTRPEFFSKNAKFPAESHLMYPKIDIPKLHEFFRPEYDDSNGKVLLLSGPPGTGKTSMLKHLIGTNLKSKLRVAIANSDTLIRGGSSAFMTFLFDEAAGELVSEGEEEVLRRTKLENPLIIIVEDAEPLIQARDKNRNGDFVSTLLNTTDGLLSGCINARFVFTYNMEHESIDAALKRKGRMFFHQEFPYYSFDEAKALQKALGKEDLPFVNAEGTTLSKDISLANIFHNEKTEADEIKPSKKATIGFH